MYLFISGNSSKIYQRICRRIRKFLCCPQTKRERRILNRHHQAIHKDGKPTMKAKIPSNSPELQPCGFGVHQVMYCTKYTNKYHTNNGHRTSIPLLESWLLLFTWIRNKLQIVEQTVNFVSRGFSMNQTYQRVVQDGSVSERVSKSESITYKDLILLFNPSLPVMSAYS